MYHTLYLTKNKINNKIYIGVHSTEQPYDNYLGSGGSKSGKIGLTAAINKYGQENFRKIVLAIFSNAESMYAAERFIVNEDFIKRSDTYNIKIGGIGAPKGSQHHFYGKTLSDKTKAKISKSLTGRKASEKTKRLLSQINKTRTLSDEAKLNQKESVSKPKSIEHRQKISQAHKGKIITQETREKMKLAWARRKASQKAL